MALPDITDPQAVLSAMQEFDASSRDEFLRAHGFGRGRFYELIHDGRAYDPKAIVGVAHGYQFPQLGPLKRENFSAGVKGANAVLRRLGFVVEDRRPTSVEAEQIWRGRVWSDLRDSPMWPEFPPSLLRDVGVYGGAQGVWVDKDRTQLLSRDGIAVSVLHTGRQYADDLSDSGVVYHYPRTRRSGEGDASEVAAVKGCEANQVPIFVISETVDGNRRTIRLAWVTAHDDESRVFLIRFGDKPSSPPVPPDADDPFEVHARRRRTKAEVERAVRDPEFKFGVARRYRGRCVLSGIAVPEMLESAHVIPVEKGGPDDERNGLLLTASLHRALDAGLWAVRPQDLTVVTRPQGPTAVEMGIRVTDLRSLPQLPHPSAVRWRYRNFQERVGLADADRQAANQKG